MAAPTMTAGAPAEHRPWYRHLYAQVLCAILLGVLLGHFYPSIGAQMKPLGRRVHQADQDADRADHLLHGGARHRQHGGHEEGRPVGIKALVYFEVMTTVALVIGLIIVNLWQPGAGMNVDPAALDTKDRGLHRQGRRAEHGRVPPAHHPEHRDRRLRRGRDPAGALVRDPVCLRAALAGRERQALLYIIDQTAHVFFGIVGIVMKRRRSAPSAPWHLPLASTASARSCRWAR